MTKQTYGAQVFSLAGGGELLIAPTSAKDVVAIEGSVFGGPNHVPKNQDIIPGLSADLLDAGTKKNAKEVIRGSLADRGITLVFGASGDRTTFSGQCLPEDLPFLLSIIAECLGEAHFPEAEVKAAKARTCGALAEMGTDTLTQADITLSRLLYEPTHVNFSRTLEEDIESVKKVSRKELLDFKNLLGRDGLVLAVTGDVKPEVVKKATEKAFAKLGAKKLVASVKPANKKANADGEKFVPIPDKANLDVLLGASLPLRKTDPLFLPAAVLVYMLGGGFISHLMQTIRERDGLTYGVNATLRGFEGGTDGYLRIWATFSPELYKKSVEALKREVRTFFASGMTADALQKKKDEITGSYLVGLSTSRGLARTLHQITIDGRDLSYLSEYPDLIRAVSLAEIHSAAELISTAKLSLAVAGTFPKS